LYDAPVDFINGAVAVNCDHTQRLTGGNLLILVEHPAIERGAFRLKPVLIAAGRCDRTLVAPAGTCQAATKPRK